jgi:outer membrane immunogenic protein
MMKTFYALLATGLAVLSASPAFAQANDDQVEPQTPAAAWSGATFELGGGFQHLTDKSYKDIDATAKVDSTSNGAAFGGAIGYDWAVGDRMTLGGEFSLYGSSGKITNTNNLVAGNFNTESVRVGRDIFVGARLGFVLSPKAELITKLGYANTHFGVTGTNGSESLYDGLNANGFRLGVGYERKLTKSLFVKVEYDYSHYGSGQFGYSNSTPDASTFDLHSDTHQLLGSIGIRF